MLRALGGVSRIGSSPAYGWVVILTWMLVHMWGFLVMETLGLFLPSMRERAGPHPRA